MLLLEYEQVALQRDFPPLSCRQQEVMPFKAQGPFFKLWIIEASIIEPVESMTLLLPTREVQKISLQSSPWNSCSRSISSGLHGGAGEGPCPETVIKDRISRPAHFAFSLSWPQPKQSATHHMDVQHKQSPIIMQATKVFLRGGLESSRAMILHTA